MNISYLDRMIEEQIELKSKISKLSNFIHKDSNIDLLSSIEFNLLNIQFSSMKTYYKVLTSRIELINGNQKKKEKNNIKKENITEILAEFDRLSRHKDIDCNFNKYVRESMDDNELKNLGGLFEHLIDDNSDISECDCFNLNEDEREYGEESGFFDDDDLLNDGEPIVSIFDILLDSEEDNGNNSFIYIEGSVGLKINLSDDNDETTNNDETIETNSVEKMISNFLKQKKNRYELPTLIDMEVIKMLRSMKKTQF